MQFLDEDSRHKFHQTTTLTQLVCSMLETFCMEHGHEAEIIDIEGDKVIVGVPNISYEAGYDICDKINVQFKRRDRRPTCVFLDQDLGLFNLLITNTSDFAQVT